MALGIARELLGARDEMFSSPRLQTGYLLHGVRLGSARIRSNATSAAVAKVLFGIFLVVFLVFLIMGLMAGRAITR